MSLFSSDFEVVFQKKKSSHLIASIIYDIWGDFQISIDLRFRVRALKWNLFGG